MTYPETTRDAVGNMIISQIDVPHCYKSHVKIFQGYVSHRNEIGKPIDNDWLSITEDDINKYKCSNECQTYMRSCSSVNAKSNVTPATKMIHSHGEQHQTDITSGEFKATNSSSSTTSNQLLSDLSISEIATTNMCLSSPCGEGNQLVKSNTTMNHNLQQCKTYATISSSTIKYLKTSSLLPTKI